MARKNTLKCTPIIRKPVIPLRVYNVFTPRNSEAIYVSANAVEENDSGLTFKIIFEGYSDREEDEEVVAMFKEWDFFITSAAEASKI